MLELLDNMLPSETLMALQAYCILGKILPCFFQCFFFHLHFDVLI